MLALLFLYYTFVSGFSGTSMFEDMVWASFNVGLAQPIVATGVFDRDMTATQALAYPELYLTVRRGLDLNSVKTSETLMSAFVHSLIILLVMILVFSSLDIMQVGD